MGTITTIGPNGPEINEVELIIRDKVRELPWQMKLPLTCADDLDSAVVGSASIWPYEAERLVFLQADFSGQAIHYGNMHPHCSQCNVDCWLFLCQSSLISSQRQISPTLIYPK